MRPVGDSVSAGRSLLLIHPSRSKGTTHHGKIAHIQLSGTRRPIKFCT